MVHKAQDDLYKLYVAYICISNEKNEKTTNAYPHYYQGFI